MAESTIKPKMLVHLKNENGECVIIEATREGKRAVAGPGQRQAAEMATKHYGNIVLIRTEASTHRDSVMILTGKDRNARAKYLEDAAREGKIGPFGGEGHNSGSKSPEVESMAQRKSATVRRQEVLKLFPEHPDLHLFKSPLNVHYRYDPYRMCSRPIHR